MSPRVFLWASLTQASIIFVSATGRARRLLTSGTVHPMHGTASGEVNICCETRRRLVDVLRRIAERRRWTQRGSDVECRPGRLHRAISVDTCWPCFKRFDQHDCFNRFRAAGRLNGAQGVGWEVWLGRRFTVRGDRRGRPAGYRRGLYASIFVLVRSSGTNARWDNVASPAGFSFQPGFNLAPLQQRRIFDWEGGGVAISGVQEVTPGKLLKIIGSILCISWF